ncbi:MAG: glycoside hydrolase family 25 protein [Clostridiaceae bacterium]|nr:glycoside hydrolase family 25 protein [Clostridiaceae bacterium]
MVKGIDVSKWNGKVDWKAVAASGVRFVMIRAAFGGKTGGCTEDPMFQSNITGATEAGLRAGIYLYSYAMSVNAAVSEANALVKLLEPHRKRITFPIAYDCEETAQTVLGKAVLTAMANAFCTQVKTAGYLAMVYANPNWLNNYYNTSELTSPIWLAQWTKTPTWKGAYDIWQHSDSGTVSGISGNVDLNIAYTMFEPKAATTEEAIDTLAEKKLINSPDYWKKVIGGDATVSAENVAALLEKWAASLSQA